MENYKEEIANTRKGCLGSSDGKTLAQIATLGIVPKSAYKRMAVVKGLIEQTEIPKTAAIKAGDDLEMLVYEHLNAKDSRYESNPLWVSKRYSKANVKLISHPDLVLVNEENKTINVFEVKTTKYSYEMTRQTYSAQLFIHYAIAKEKALERGKDWKVRLFLVHYDTNGLDLTQGITFESERLSVKSVQFNSPVFDIDKAMTIANGFLETFTEYYEGDEVNADMLPEPVRNKMMEVTTILNEIKEREQKVEDFKQKLYAFMELHDIKNIKNDFFSITAVAPTESKSFDHKRYIEDLKKQYPRKAKKIIAEYTKTTKRKGYATIKTFEN